MKGPEATFNLLVDPYDGVYRNVRVALLVDVAVHYLGGIGMLF
jgi:hypothetical protein